MSERQTSSQLQDARSNNQAQNKNIPDDNEERNRQMKNLDDLQKELCHMKRKLNDASIRAHKLNIDVATMFNPETLATLEENKEQCDICLTRMSQTLNENLENAILSDEKQSAADETA